MFFQLQVLFFFIIIIFLCSLSLFAETTNENEKEKKKKLTKEKKKKWARFMTLALIYSKGICAQHRVFLFFFPLFNSVSLVN